MRNVIKKVSKVVASVLLLVPVVVHAQTPSSTNYSVEESSFSSGSGIDSNSASYNARASAGDLGVGEAYSANYGAYAGPISPREEYLEMVVNATVIDLGTLTDSATSFGSGTFYVRAYMNSSYSVVTLSQPMTNEGGDVLDAKSSTGVPIIGTEEFGMNLVDNASPNIGSNPAPQPNASYANGEAAPGYDTADSFRYGVGETVAQHGGNPAWGQTYFTISYIVNISGITPAGVYSMAHELTAVPTF